MEMEIDFEKMGGLVPAIIQDAVTKNVLMLGFMNKEAYEKTIATKKSPSGAVHATVCGPKVRHRATTSTLSAFRTTATKTRCSSRYIHRVQPAIREQTPAGARTTR